MVGVGLIMIPLPTPFGCVVAGAGMAVLGTEFPQAQRILDQTRDAVVDVIEKNCVENHVTASNSMQEKHPKEPTSTTNEHDDKEPTSTKTSQVEEQEESSIDKEEEDVVVVRDTPDRNDIPLQEPSSPSQEPPPLRRPIMKEFSLGNIRDSIKRRAKTLGQKAVPILKMIGTKEATTNTCSEGMVVDGNVNVDQFTPKDQPPSPPPPQTTLPAYDAVPELSPLSLEAHNVPSWSSFSLNGNSSGIYDESL